MVGEHFKNWNQSKYRVLMIKTVLYFHGFASSSDSKKAKVFKKYISSLNKSIKVIVPDLNNNFKDAVE